jgi:hypothetical protein
MTAITAADRPEMIGFTLTHSMLRAELDVLSRCTVTPANRQTFEEHLRVVTDHSVRPCASVKSPTGRVVASQPSG